ncbi:LexA family protein [Litorimonas sp. WD9-15]|uniref:LexA family protein n=1 Tax=Litorimonas sp. WD9-15 TaxID=3418716 RepID=UPI003D01AFCB
MAQHITSGIEILSTARPIGEATVHGRMVKQPAGAAPSRQPTGFPSPATDHLEDVIDPVGWIVRHPGASFWFVVEGDGLKGQGILDGDLIVVDRAGTLRSGRVAVCVHDGMFLLKLVKRDSTGRPWLFSDSPESRERPIPFNEGTIVEGVIAGVVRRCPIG